MDTIIHYAGFFAIMLLVSIICIFGPIIWWESHALNSDDENSKPNGDDD